MLLCLCFVFSGNRTSHLTLNMTCNPKTLNSFSILSNLSLMIFVSYFHLISLLFFIKIINIYGLQHDIMCFSHILQRARLGGLNIIIYIIIVELG